MERNIHVALFGCLLIIVTNGAKVIHIRRLKSDPGVNLLS
ncbi:chemotaxis protein [Kosakonia cowanii]|nr:chemotaxis protein [Kosakonia cowanii]